MLDNIRQFNTDRGDLEELVALHAFGLLVKDQFEAFDIETPEWFEPKLRAIKREVLHRQADLIEKRLQDAKNRLENYKTPGEKKRELQAEITRLEALKASAD